MKKRPSLIIIFPVFMLMLTIVGCSPTRVLRLYDGDILGDAEVAKVDIPSTVVLLAVDGGGAAFRASSFAGTGAEYHLLPGRHELVVRFSIVWDTGGGEIDKLVSKSVKFSMLLEAGRSYRLAHVPVKYYSEAQKLAANPEFWLESSDGRKTTLDSVIARRPQVRHAAAEKLLPSGDGTVNPELLSLDLMKFWWKKANSNERQQFLSWIDSQRS